MDEMLRKSLVVILIILVNIKDAAPKLHITRMYTPEAISTGKPYWLECEYEGDGDKIYALKWYLGLDEFYRWTPAETPQKKTFPIQHNPIEVDLGASEKGRVRIKWFSLEANGVYRCEVSAETPTFHTDSKISHIRVFDLPDSRPVITGVEKSYHLHEEVRLNCSSPLSYPIANLTFCVNGDEVDKSWLIPFNGTGDHFSPLETAVLGLKFKLWPTFLKEGLVVITCWSEVGPLYREYSEAYIHVDIPQHASVMEGRASSAQRLKSTTNSGLASLAAVFFFCFINLVL